MLRYFNYLMILLFAFFAAFQFNDPNPFVWIMIYSAACAISILFAIRKLHWVMALILAVLTSIWALTITPELTSSGFRYIFDEFQMRASGVEEAREFSGLMIVALWSVTLAWSAKRKKEG